MQHRDKITLKKVHSELKIGIELLGSTGLNDFLDNEILKRALAMTTINIGELIKSTTQELRQKYPDIPWQAIAGMRDITAHKYQTLRMEDVYNTVRNDFPALQQQIESIIATV